MPKFEVSFYAPVMAYKTLIVEAVDEDEAYNTANELIDEPFYNDPTKWELEFTDHVEVDDVKEIGVETTPVTRS